MKEKLKNKFLGVYEPSENKEKSMIILLIWLVFIVGIIIFINASKVENIENNNTEVKEETKVFSSLKDIFSKYDNKYSYDITITLEDNSNISFKGLINDNINTGVKVINNETIAYEISDLTSEEEINNIYDGLLSEFFIPKNIYNYIIYLKALENIEDNLKTYSYEYTYNDKDITFKIITDEENIVEIEYKYDNLIYNLKYMK